MADFLVNKIPLPIPRPHEIADVAVDPRIYNPVTHLPDIWSEHLVGTAWLSYPWTWTKETARSALEKAMNFWNEATELSNQFYGWLDSTWKPTSDLTDFLISVIGITIVATVVTLVILGGTKLINWIRKWKM